jgi:hypothetical protein
MHLYPLPRDDAPLDFRPVFPARRRGGRRIATVVVGSFGFVPPQTPMLIVPRSIVTTVPPRRRRFPLLPPVAALSVVAAVVVPPLRFSTTTLGSTTAFLLTFLGPFTTAIPRPRARSAPAATIGGRRSRSGPPRPSSADAAVVPFLIPRTAMISIATMARGRSRRRRRRRRRASSDPLVRPVPVAVRFRRRRGRRRRRRSAVGIRPLLFRRLRHHGLSTLAPARHVARTHPPRPASCHPPFRWCFLSPVPTVVRSPPVEARHSRLCVCVGGGGYVWPLRRVGRRGSPRLLELLFTSGYSRRPARVQFLDQSGDEVGEIE